jgi:anti-anti-sigma factor
MRLMTRLEPPDPSPAPRLMIAPAPGGLALSGEVDAANWGTLSQGLRTCLDLSQGESDVMVDLAGLSFIDAHGVGVIAEAANGLGRSRRLALRQAPRILVRIAGILDVDRDPSLVIEERHGDG